MFNFLKGRLIIVRIILLCSVLGLLALGIATIYAVGHPAETSVATETAELQNLWKKQAVFVAVAAVGFIAANSINYRKLGYISYWLYGLILLLLLILLISRYIIPLPYVPEINGTHRWIKFDFAGISLPAIQPSEFCKIIYILALAWYLRYRSNYRNFTSLLGPFALTVLPMLMILLEPDLGTVMLMMPVLFIMLFVAGAKVKHLLIIILMAILISPLLWMKMADYQRIRISSVVLQNNWVRKKAEQHPLIGKILVGSDFSAKKWEKKWGYHLLRSKFAVASGGVDGYGFRKGPFIKYNFLPTRHNDFVFSAIAHQWGFKGSVLLLSLYAVILACGIEIAGHNTDPFGRFLAIGITAMLTMEVIVNISMTVGLMPITGLTLPFVSYGGSSLLVSMIAAGLLNNVGRCRPFGLARRKQAQSLSVRSAINRR